MSMDVSHLNISWILCIFEF